MNDNAPYLVISSVIGNVSESAKPGTIIMKLDGADFDEVSLISGTNFYG